MKKLNQRMVSNKVGRPRFSKVPFSLRTKVAGMPRGGMVKNLMSNLKRSRKGL